jgi:hypothetical protein
MKKILVIILKINIKKEKKKELEKDILNKEK